MKGGSLTNFWHCLCFQNDSDPNYELATCHPAVTARDRLEIPVVTLEGQNISHTSSSNRSIPFKGSTEFKASTSVETQQTLEGSCTMGTNVAEPSLYVSITDSLLKNDDGQLFLPDGKLKGFITPRRLGLELQQNGCCTSADEKFRVHLSKYIIDRAIRCFATLVIIDKVREIETFFRNGLDDSYLPFAFEFQKEKEDCVAAWTVIEEAVSTSSGETMTPPTDDPVSLTFQGSIDRRFLNNFEEKQWLFQAPIFTESNWKRSFHTQRPLPFLNLPAASTPRDTLFSRVIQRAIHCDHIKAFGRNPQRQQHFLVAVKELRQSTDTVKIEASLGDADSDEEKSLQTIRQLNHPHLIKAIAAYERKNQHYFVFPWAEHGNLREFWEKWNRLGDLPWVIGQLEGLCDAIRKLHERNWRHGDLKPENILCFEDSEISPGILVIADVGLLKVQSLHTQLRTVATRTMTGTWLYCPPQDRGSPRSRQYDVWSMGGIILEIIICALYGPHEVERLHRLIQRYYTGEGTVNARVHPEVKRWIRHMYQDSRCGTESNPTALRLLLKLVDDRLLVVKIRHDQSANEVQSFVEHDSIDVGKVGIPEVTIEHMDDLTIDAVASTDSLLNSQSQGNTIYRADSNELYETIRSIRERCISQGLPLFTPHDPRRVYSGPAEVQTSLTVPNTAQAARMTTRSSQALNTQELGIENPKDLDDVWVSSPDNEFASKLFKGQCIGSLAFEDAGIPKLCQRCSLIDPWSSGQKLEDSLPGFLEKSTICDLCKVLLSCLPRFGIREKEWAKLFLFDSSFKLHDTDGPKVLSIYTLPRFSDCEPITSSIQFGFPKLPGAGTQTHFKVLREWLRICDATHDCHRGTREFLPTRVLDVGGNKDSRSVRLFCKNQNKTTPATYIALSHRWGNPKDHRPFCTTRSNLAHFQNGIDYDQLPQTFQDAITVTRNLGVRFLWIDSLCIIQDDADDWKAESERMEAVFSSAYCTISATCASGSTDGFLKERPPREYVKLRADGKPDSYVCESIDDFQFDVEESELQSRGWVLQERALASRTIHYTKRQAYWECGQGIRTETLTTMRNRKASILGDADFPTSAEKYVKGGRIRLYEILYERYCKLAFTIVDDRPVAISGLEERLLRTFESDGGYGIFQKYLHRSLLWKRSGATLKRIDSLRGQKIPSWSWMAYTGSINYMDIPFGKAEWSEDIQSPFSEGVREQTWGGSGPLNDRTELTVTVRDFLPGRGQLFFDEPDRKHGGKLRCVVFGKQKAQEKSQPNLFPAFVVSSPEAIQDHYVLIIVKTGHTEGREIYERVAVGYMASQDIMPASTKEFVVIR